MKLIYNKLCVHQELQFFFLLTASILLFIIFNPTSFTWFKYINIEDINNSTEMKKDKENSPLLRDSPWWDSYPTECTEELPVDTVSKMPSTAEGTCGRRSLVAGPKQKVFSLSLYGSNNFYFKHLPELLEDVHRLYPEWIIRLYIQPSGMKSFLCPLLKSHSYLHICNVNDLPKPFTNLCEIHPKVWRFLPMGDHRVEVMLCRDIDAQVLKREVDAVEDWLKTNKSFHVIRDNPFHSEPIMGGMWGVQRTQGNQHMLDDILKRMVAVSKGPMHYNWDQQLLKDVLWKDFSNDTLSHDSFLCTRFAGTIPFPTQRNGTTFIGNQIYQGVNDSINIECPVECRPKDHQDWKYC